ncbi:ABC transporter permease [Tengunoibacter tsumagoiensis]|uniref:ABC3 transporter permease C-terminal domain-containing protein n=1 Tax=Tengunoibacter tsumagoiensis TaxID=2014871 RepID=A0A402A1A5_9CHLR|nr:ABC transporter permease [Tengunoibacter tsumagoiensis]GCE12913.1 hypothetical protein KTT_27720 [Tengunoibacter tsumagoiensis]
MAATPIVLPHRRSLALIPGIVRLSLWRFAQTWRFLFITWSGLLAMVILVCALPLFSRVAISADLRSLASTTPDGPDLQVHVGSTHITDTQVQDAAHQVDQILHQGAISPYLREAPQFFITTSALTLQNTSSQSQNLLTIVGSDLTQSTSHLTMVQGRLPQKTTDESIEVALPEITATAFHLQVGSTLQAHFPVLSDTAVWTIHVVGLIAPAATTDTYWSAPRLFGSQSINGGGPTIYNALADRAILQAKSNSIQIDDGSGGARKKGLFADAFHFIWSYPFDLSHLDADMITQIAQQLDHLPTQLQDTFQQPDLPFAFPTGSLFQQLRSYNQQMIVLQIVSTILLLMTLALILFLVSILSNLLVERQTPVIATLRSRGATRQHIFGTFATQGVILSLAALLIGPWLSIVLVRLIAQALLTPANQQALHVITDQPLQSLLNIKWYALFAIMVALGVMLLAIHRASTLDIVLLRRESSQTRRVPFWRRLNLDLLLILIIMVAYGSYTFLWQSLSTAQELNPIEYSLLQGFGLIAPAFVVSAILLLFLRLLPSVLRGIRALCARQRGASATLAFAQMERRPQAATRTIVLLALTIASSTFLLTLIATKEVRTSNAAAYATSYADYAGQLPASEAHLPIADLKARYAQIPEILSANIGYTTLIQPGSVLTSNAVGPITIHAVDADTYARTVNWPAELSSQSLTSLMSQLVAHRQEATTQNLVYALVDAPLWGQLHLAPGSHFTLPADDNGDTQIQFVAVAEVPYLPGIYDTPLAPYRGIGMLTDYTSYATVIAKQSQTTLIPNQLLLKTKSDAASLAHLRSLFPGLQDRRQQTVTNQESSVHLDIIGVLIIAIVAALLLALVGTLLNSWLSASIRITSFSVLRALGMRPRQIATVLLWEQGFIYAVAILLGLGLSAMLSLFASPIVTLLDLTRPATRENLYDVPPISVTIPWFQLALLFGTVTIICLCALFFMAHLVSRPRLGQILRLNED